ncbi:MAG: hypothetical protein DRI97_12225, partial [Bacteroidetes bacterium]
MLVDMKSLRIILPITTISILLTILLFFGLIDTNTDIEEKESVGKAPNDWFFRQRAFPQGSINYDAYKVAYQQASIMKE